MALLLNHYDYVVFVMFLISEEEHDYLEEKKGKGVYHGT